MSLTAHRYLNISFHFNYIISCYNLFVVVTEIFALIITAFFIFT